LQQVLKLRDDCHAPESLLQRGQHPPCVLLLPVPQDEQYRYYQNRNRL